MNTHKQSSVALPLIEIGEFTPSADIAAQFSPLPTTVIDSGWVCAFSVRVSKTQWFGGLAFPTNQDNLVKVGLLALSNPTMTEEQISSWYKQLEDELRSRVATAWASREQESVIQILDKAIIRTSGFGKPKPSSSRHSKPPGFIKTMGALSRQSTPPPNDSQPKQYPAIQLGKFMDSAKARQESSNPNLTLPVGVVDAGWACPFSVLLETGEFKGLAFPCNIDDGVGVGLAITESVGLSQPELDLWFRKLEDALRSQVGAMFLQFQQACKTLGISENALRQ